MTEAFRLHASLRDNMPTSLSRRSFSQAAFIFTGSLGAKVSTTAALCSLANECSGRTVYPSQFGAKGDGATDDTIALQRAVTAAITQNRVLDLGRGTYRVRRSIIGEGNIRIINSGGAVILASPGEYPEFGVLVLRGRAVSAGRLSASVAQSQTKLTVTQTEQFSPGSLGVIYNSEDYSFSAFRRYYRAGEFFRVDAVDAPSLLLSAPLYDGYRQDAVEVARIKPITGYVRDIDIRSQGGPESLIVIDYADGFELTNPVFRGANNSAVVISRSLRCRVIGPDIENFGAGGDDYGVVFSNSQSCRLSGGKVFARRHPVAIGGSDQPNGVPCRDIVIGQAILRNDSASAVHSADLHGNTEKCGYDGCVIFGGFSPQGRDSFIKNCTVHAMSIGTAIYGAELLGGYHVIEGNVFHFAADPSESSRGAIDFGGNSDAITAGTVETLTIQVKRNTFFASNFSQNTMLLYARNAGTSQTVNIDFTDNKIMVNRYHSFVLLRHSKGVASSEFVNIARNSTSFRADSSLYLDGDYSNLAQLKGAAVD